jgi:hypothetical protein
MLGFDGEFSHPAIDRELDGPGARARVQSLIDSAKGGPPAAAPLPPPPSVAGPPPFCPSREAYFEDLGRQHSNLSRLLWEGGPLWGAERRALERAVESAEARKAFLESQIAGLSQRRQGAQEAALRALERLEGTDRDVRRSSGAIRAAVARMRGSPE